MKAPLCICTLSIIIIIQLSTVAAFPVKAQQPGEDNFLPRDGHAIDDVFTQETEEDRKRSATIDPELLTAGDLIYHTYEQLSPELYSWLFEMDIVKNSRTVKTVLESNGLVEPEHNSEEGMLHRERKTAGVNSDYLWPEGRIPYVFESSVSSAGRMAALKGMDHWMQHTCLQFVPRGENDIDYIQFAERDGCWSYVGMQGGMQLLSLGRGVRSYCKLDGVVNHELGHAIGHWHEQSRPDRDQYIRILWHNIEPDAYESFYKYSRSEVKSFSLPYDYESIMHYPENAFSRNDELTIVALNPNVKVMGQRKSLSPLDIKLTNLLYNCEVTRSIEGENVNFTNAIPKDSFLILNSQTHTCLDVSNRTTDWTAPIMDQHDYTGFYYVSLTECRPESRDQFWQWTRDGSLLHLGTFLCLTALEALNVPMNFFETDLLVLMHCRSGYGRQHWVCADDFLENPSLGKCVKSAHDSEQKNKRGVDDREKDEEDSMVELADELKQFMTNEHTTVSTTQKKKYNFPIIFEHPKLSNYSTMASLDYCEHTEGADTWNSVYYNDTCLQLGPSVCSINTTESHNLPTCYNKDMSGSTGLRFFYVDWIGCEELGYYASGFYHTNQISGNGATAVLTGINCCPSGSIFTGHTDSPPAILKEDCVEIEWWNWQDTLISEGWFSCPRGMFLKSFLITIRPYTLGHYIWKVKCCKPPLSSVVYEHCYKDYGTTAMDTGLHRCNLEGYHVTGMYKKCSEDSKCVEEIMCCMALGV